MLRYYILSFGVGIPDVLTYNVRFNLKAKYAKKALLPDITIVFSMPNAPRRSFGHNAHVGTLVTRVHRAESRAPRSLQQ
jgi:hypothetical protein